MRDLLRRTDPGFYDKEPSLLQTQAQIPRYPEEAQAEARIDVLRADRMLPVVTTIVAVAAYAVITGAGALDASRDWTTLWAFAVLAVAAPRALPWWPAGDANATWRHALLGVVLVAVPALWMHVEWMIFVVAAVAGLALLVSRGRNRLVLVAVAVVVLLAHVLLKIPLLALLLGGACYACYKLVPDVWRPRPQIVVWMMFAALFAVCAYAFAFATAAVALRLPVELVALSIAYLGLCVIAGRIRRAELLARPEGLLSIPQSIVPMLDRSQHHAVICWLA